MYHYSADSVACFVNIYPLDNDLSGGQRYHFISNLRTTRARFVREYANKRACSMNYEHFDQHGITNKS